MDGTPIHQHDPDAAPDGDFVGGRLRHLAIGASGRMLDPRRTPVRVLAVDPALGTFEVEVLAFEDAGARWTIEAERVRRFQFEPGGPRADAATVAALRAAIARFDRPLRVPAERQTRALTIGRIEAAERAALRHLAGAPLPDVAARTGDTELQGRLRMFFAARGVDVIERAFAARFASNPGAGELVKGHAIVLARLGLVPFRGKAIRDPGLFSGDWTEERRAEHIVARLGFVRAQFRRAGLEQVRLHRGMTSEEPIRRRRPVAAAGSSFMSATFDPAVARSLASPGPMTVASALWSQVVPVERIFMTHVETAELNAPYQEAEAVLLADPSNPFF